MSKIELYTGEFTVWPVPTQLSLNYCSHKCAYCFANLNKPERKADVKALSAQLANFEYHGEQNIVSHYLRERYPVALSNLVDPFATSNYLVADPIIHQMIDLKIPIAFQTRGGSVKPAQKALTYALDHLPPTVFYVSIPMLDENLRKRIEPGAPPIQYRLDMVREMIAKGHRVIVAANPSDWIGDHEAYIKAIYDTGARHIWTGLMHLSHEQIRNLSPRERHNLGEEAIANALLKFDVNSDRVQEQADLSNAIHAAGMDHLSTDTFFATDFFDIYGETYGWEKVLPTATQFLYEFGQRVDSDDEVVKITLKDWLDYALPFTPLGEFHMPGYLFNRDRSWYDKHPDFPKRMTFDRLLAEYWNHPHFLCISSMKEATLAIEGWHVPKGKKPRAVPVRDEDGNLVYLFRWSGFTDIYEPIHHHF